MKSNNVVPLSTHTVASPSGQSLGTHSLKTRVTAHIQASTKQYIKKHLSNVFNEVDDYLFDQSGRLMEGVSTQALLDNMLMLRENRDQFTQALQSSVEKQLSHLNHLQSKKTTYAKQAQLLKAEELALIDKAQLEKSVCINTIIQHANEKNTPVLLEIKNAFCLLFNHHEIQDEINPLGPYFLCHAFLTICEEHDIELPVYLILFKHFERLFTHNLNELYSDIISLLDKHNLITKKDSQRPLETQYSHTHQVINNTNQENQTYSQHEFNTIELANSINLLNLLANSSASLGQPYLPINQLKPSLADLSGVLSQQQLVNNIHHQATESLQYQRLTNIIPKLMQSVFEQTKQDIAQPEEDMLNLTSMFFDFILNDENQSKSIRALIAQLQLPILTLAIEDKTFFQSNDHPARQFINLVSKAGFGLTDSDEQKNHHVFEKIKDIVQQIKDCKRVNASTFEHHKNTLSEFLARDEHRIKLLEKRFGQAEKGKAQLEYDSKAVANKIKQVQSENPSIGVPIKAFLSNEWKKVMLQTLLKHGQNSHQWQDRCNTLDSLITLCNQCQDDIKSKTFEESFSAVKTQILSSLEEAGIISNAKDLIFMNPTLFHSAVSLCQFNDEPPIEKTDLFIEDTEKSEVIVKEDNCHSELISNPELTKDCIEKAKALTIGQWFEHKGTERSEYGKRVKLVVKLDIIDRYVFMDSSGKKAGEFSQIEMASLLASGQIKALDSAPVVERAVIDISSKIQQAS